MIKNSELALISDEALSAMLALPPVPEPQVPLAGPRPVRGADAVARGERSSEFTTP